MLPLWITTVPSFHEVDFQGHDSAQDRYNPATLFSLPPPVLPFPASTYSLGFESLSGSSGSSGRSSTARHGRETGVRCSRLTRASHGRKSLLALFAAPVFFELFELASRHCVSWIELQRLLQVSDGRIVVQLARVGEGEHGVSFR